MYYQVEQVLEKQEPEIEKFYKGRGILICRIKTESVRAEGIYRLFTES